MTNTLKIWVCEMTVQFNDDPKVPLTKYPFWIMRYLAENSGKYITTVEMLEEVWEKNGVFVNNNNVGQHIYRLKGFLNKDVFLNKFAHGYKLNAEIEWMDKVKCPNCLTEFTL